MKPTTDPYLHDDEDEAGFTLVELLVVLAIVAVVAAVSAIGIGASQDPRRAASTASKVAASLRQARVQAIQTGEAVSVTVSPRPPGIEVSGRPAFFLGSNIDLAVQTGRDTADADPQGPRQIVFMPDGRSSGAQITIRVGSATRKIEVDWLTGLVREVAHAGL